MLRALALALRHFLLAVQFFTRIPVTGRLAMWVGFSPVMLRASAAHFPGVGGLIALLLGALAWFLLRCVPAAAYAPLVVGALVCVASLFLTGALHEDGLADVADGLGGGLDRDRALLIMKDSRVGAYGAIAVAMALLLRVVLVASLAAFSLALARPELLFVILLLAQVSARSWPLLTIWCLPHVGDAAGSKSKPLADQIGWPALSAALAWNGLIWGGALAWLGPASPIVGAAVGGLLLNALVWRWLLRWFRQRLQGFTGDCLGATQLVGELAFYLGAILFYGSSS